MNGHRKCIAALFAGCLVAFLAFFAVFSLKGGQNEIVECADWIYLNGVRYDPYDSLKNYHIADVLICKTKSGGRAYEIEEFPDRGYIALYYAWDGTIYKRTGEHLADG